MRAITIIKGVLVGLVALLAICMMVFTVASVTTLDRADRNLFGYKAFIVLSDSMKATDFAAGDLVIVKETDCSTLEAGDIITYTSQNTSNYGEVVTHKIRELTTDADGNPGFVTYGTTTDTNDETVVTYPCVLGKYEWHLVGVGSFFQFLKTAPGYICCVLVPFLVLILMEAAHSVCLFRRYKGERFEELRAERKKADAERPETQRMLQGLTQLKTRAGQSAYGGAYESTFVVAPAAAPAPRPQKARPAHFATSRR